MPSRRSPAGPPCSRSATASCRGRPSRPCRTPPPSAIGSEKALTGGALGFSAGRSPPATPELAGTLRIFALDRHPCDQVNLVLGDGRQRIGGMEWLRSDALHLLDEVAGLLTGSRELPLPGQPQQVPLAAWPRGRDGGEAAVQALLLDARGRIRAEKSRDVPVEPADLRLQVSRIGLEFWGTPLGCGGAL